MLRAKMPEIRANTEPVNCLQARYFHSAREQPPVFAVVAGILAHRPHPEQGYRACLGLMRLGRLHGADRLEAACHRAERLRSYRYRTVEQILINQQDRLPLDEAAPARPALTHENLRGAIYYEEAYADA